MVVRNITGIVLILALAGCATTQRKNSVAQLEMKVSQLERQLEYKDDEIRSLKYELEDLSGQITKPAKSTVSKTATSTALKNNIPGYKETGVVRMPVSTLEVQQALQNAGVYDGPVDGKIGNQTKQSIAEFQKQNNLTADGIVGIKTWAALEKYLK